MRHDERVDLVFSYGQRSMQCKLSWRAFNSEQFCDFPPLLLCAIFVLSVSLWWLLPGNTNHRDTESTEVAQRNPLGHHHKSCSRPRDRSFFTIFTRHRTD